MFYPMFAMVIVTFVVAIYLLCARISAVKQRQISVRYFQLNTSDKEPPPHLVRAERHYSNLFEVPLLFYVTCIVAMVLQFQNDLLVILAWIFVVSRILHAFIHLTYNKVLHRMAVFLFGTFCVLAMWIVLAAHYMAR